jgi:hypothetical protein
LLGSLLSPPFSGRYSEHRLPHRRNREAETFCKEALRIWQKVLGPEHPDMATGLNDLASLYQEAFRIRQKVLGSEHPDTAISLNNLAYCEFDLGRIEQTTELARQASATDLTILSKVFAFTTE